MALDENPGLPEGNPTTPSVDAQGALVGKRTPEEVARENWRRYEYVRSRGHVTYCEQARKCENFYLGGGLQWDPDVLAQLGERMATEVNEILGSVNAAIGYQIAQRMDIQFVPRGQGATEQVAKVLNLVVKQILDNTKFKWHETELWSDGLIQQRGYVDIRMGFDDNVFGEVTVRVIDPMDGIPDPDAKSYDPEDWQDFTETRWLTADEIAAAYGDKAAELCRQRINRPEADFGDGTESDAPRARFGDDLTSTVPYDSYITDGSIIRYRVVDRQHHIWSTGRVAIYPTGDVRSIDGLAEDELQDVIDSKVPITTKRIKRVRWTVSAACDVLLHDDWSPYDKITVVPFFPYFRRGRTRGMVDNAISPQEMKNKALSQSVSIINSNAHSGWLVPQNSLTADSTEDLEDHGASNGLILEYDSKVGKPEKISPSPLPTGMKMLVDLATQNIQSVTGINESMLGMGQQDMSGVAVQSRQYAAQQQLALPLDNLARTRHMVATRVLDCVQDFMSDERIFRITHLDGFGRPQTQEIPVNQVQPDGSILNDLTVGEYDLVISEQPMQITFDNSQFEQVKAMVKDMGIPIPPRFILRYSNLADKSEIADAIEKQQQPPQDPTVQAKADLLQAQAAATQANVELTKAKTAQTNVTAVYSATQAAAQAEAIPHLAPVADAILESSGFPNANPIPQDAGGGIAAPVPALSPGQVTQTTTMPGDEPQALARMPHNTDPLTPAHPDQGVDAGIRKPGVQP